MTWTKLARLDILHNRQYIPALCDDGIVRSICIQGKTENAQSVSAAVKIRGADVSGFAQIEDTCQLCLLPVESHDKGLCPDGRDVHPVKNVLRFHTNVYGQNAWMIKKLTPKTGEVE